jgi:TubC N-terminal docking domain
MRVSVINQLELPGINQDDVEQLLAELNHRGVALAVIDNRLRFRPTSAVSPDLLLRLKQNKADLIAHIQARQTSPPQLDIGDPILSEPSLITSERVDGPLHDARLQRPVADTCDQPLRRNAEANSIGASESRDSSDSQDAAETHVKGDSPALVKPSTDPEDCVRSSRKESQDSPESLELPGLIEWFQANRPQLPTEPFLLRPGCRVTLPDSFYAAVERDIVAGPEGLRARYGLAGDLEDLRRLVEQPSTDVSRGRPESAKRFFAQASNSICQTHSCECGHVGPTGRPGPILQHMRHQ